MGIFPPGQPQNARSIKIIVSSQALRDLISAKWDAGASVGGKNQFYRRGYKERKEWGTDRQVHFTFIVEMATSI
jgi:hypothetical protein